MQALAAEQGTSYKLGGGVMYVRVAIQPFAVFYFIVMQ
jgi:hypothetical protein